MGRLTRLLLVATRNAHKLEEIRAVLSPAPVRLVGPEDLRLPELEEEDGLEPFDTFEANARSKASYFHRRSGVLTLADDSGLCVEALGGGPGVRTKRFAPDDWADAWGRHEANNRWLLERLSGLPPEERGASYRCTIALSGEGGQVSFEGRVDGSIACEPRGSGGFGYDPLFILDGSQQTYAELPAEVKNRTSHRGRALRKALSWLCDAAVDEAPSA